MKNRYKIKLNPAIPLFFLIAILHIYFCQILDARTDLTIEDEIAMSQMVKNSKSIDELLLCQKLFPNSPFYDLFQKRILRLEKQKFNRKGRLKFSEFSKHYDSTPIDVRLNVNDEIVLSRLVEDSNSQKGFQLFIRLFPQSAYTPHFTHKLLLARKGHVVEKDEESLKDIEEQVLEDTEEKAAEEKPVEKKEAEGKQTEMKKENKETENKEPEEDWAKIEVGIPTQLKITGSNGDVAETAGSPTGIYLGWSSEVWMDIGGGTGLEYFVIELDSNGDELQHLFLDIQIRGRLFGLVNWGIGYGSGITTLNKKNKPDNLEIIPGQGIMQTFSFGLTYGSFGLNYSIGNFNGSYQWTLTNGLSVSTGDESWKGTVNMITVEYLY